MRGIVCGLMDCQHGVPRSIVVLNVAGEVLDSCCPVAIKPDMVAAIAVEYFAESFIV